MELSQILENTIYFLALINPASKILYLAAKQPAYSNRDLFRVSIKSSAAALVILLILTTTGNFLLETIFHVEVYSLSVAGGIILFIIGLNAVRFGRFYEKKSMQQEGENIAIVPLAAPMIAGPGIMTAAISFASIHGELITTLCLVIAIFINFVIMLFSSKIGNFLEKISATGAVIRITGLIVTSVAMQMIFNGCTNWIHKTIV